MAQIDLRKCRGGGLMAETSRCRRGPPRRPSWPVAATKLIYILQILFRESIGSIEIIHDTLIKFSSFLAPRRPFLVVS